jgi:transcription initiation factor TFIIF subunit alpha
MRGANRYEGMAEEDDDEDEEDELTNTGKDIKKLVRKNDRSGAYDSDEDDLSVSEAKITILLLTRR